MKKIFLFCVVVIISSTACSNGERQQVNDAATQLFNKSRQLIEVYIDSMKSSKDSVTLLRLAHDFDTKITTVNYQFPPDTDLDLSEDENDSLIRMSKRMGEIVKERLEFFGRRNNSDSIPVNDSIPPVIISQEAPPSRNPGN